jgi:8-oxo-dGTP pyrophosphatase MutT (NUDIX family)
MTAVESMPAATVVVARPGDAGFEVLMLRRNSKHAFGGMWVFPGGKVDPHDADPVAPDDEARAARRAAVREAREEAGIDLDVESLAPISHWTPPPQAPRRFTTWFFVTEAPIDCTVTIDGDEINDHTWSRPAHALQRARAGEIEMAAPTWMTLSGLAQFTEFAEYVADARQRPELVFATHLAHAETGPVAIWEGDAGYDDADLECPGPRHRLYMGRGPWRYEGHLFVQKPTPTVGF